MPLPRRWFRGRPLVTGSRRCRGTTARPTPDHRQLVTAVLGLQWTRRLTKRRHTPNHLTTASGMSSPAPPGGRGGENSALRRAVQDQRQTEHRHRPWSRTRRCSCTTSVVLHFLRVAALLGLPPDPKPGSVALEAVGVTNPQHFPLLAPWLVCYRPPPAHPSKTPSDLATGLSVGPSVLLSWSVTTDQPPAGLWTGPPR